MIALINMPFASANHPSLALGQLKSLLTGSGIRTRVFNFNIDFAASLGYIHYARATAQIGGMPLQICEWLFSAEAWGRDFGPGSEEMLEMCGRPSFLTPGGESRPAWLDRVRRETVPAFLDRCVERLSECGATAVGFTCTYFQTIASLALARRMKWSSPGTSVVLGGASFHGPMGLEIFEKFPFADAVSLGEADDVAVPLFEGLRENGPDRCVQDERNPFLDGLQGIAYRRRPGGPVLIGTPARPVGSEVLNSLPLPDYAEYFQDVSRPGFMSEAENLYNHYLPFETSRGCWKGQSQHCAFCGLNPQELIGRKKSPERVMETIRHLRKTYGSKHLHATDNLLPRESFTDLLPMLKQTPPPPGTILFCEIRTTVTRNEVRLLSEAGFKYVQPGVESLSTNILKCMRKGVTALKNIHFLKLCLTYGISPRWNMLFRVPGETAEDYRAMAALIPRLLHLPPPLGPARPVELQPFSPFFEEGDLWVESRTPKASYRGLFPEDEVDIDKVAYFFDTRWRNLTDPSSYKNFETVTTLWKGLWKDPARRPLLATSERPDGSMLIRDSRSAKRGGTWELEPDEAAVLSAFDDPATIAGANVSRLPDLKAEEIAAMARRFVTLGLFVEEGGRFLNLAVPDWVPEPIHEFDPRNG